MENHDKNWVYDQFVCNIFSFIRRGINILDNTDKFNGLLLNCNYFFNIFLKMYLKRSNIHPHFINQSK